MTDPRVPVPTEPEGRVWQLLGSVEARLRAIELTTIGGASGRVPTTTAISQVVAGQAGSIVFATDTGTLYVSTGSAWKAV